MTYQIYDLSNLEISLREEKFALTRLSILNNSLMQLETDSLEKLDIDSICKNLKISRRTFFNYFPQKSYIMQFLLSIWVYELSLEFDKVKSSQDGISLIKHFISLFSMKLKENTNVSKEFINQLFNMKLKDLDKIPPLNIVEKHLLGFDADLDLSNPFSFNHIIEYSVNKAISSNQIPKDTSIHEFCMLLQSLILGTLQVILFNDINLESSDHFETIVNKQLDIYINGLNFKK